MPSSPPPPTNPDCPATRHGTPEAYKYDGCRCPEARRAVSKAHEMWKLRVSHEGPDRIDPTGTIRRIRALAAAGWPFHLLTDRPPCTVAALARGGFPTVTRVTARRYTAIYEALEHEPGPSRAARNRAAQKSWFPPECWFEVDMDDPSAEPITIKNFIGVDEVAVERLRGGHLRFELARDIDVGVVFTQMRYAGISPHDAAELVGVDDLVALRYWKRMDRHG